MSNTGALASLGAAIGSGLNSVGRYSSNAAARANAVSAGAQSAAANFNQSSANNANNINAGTLANQYGYNSARMAEANAYNTNMWEQTAAWNESMWEKQAQYNAEQAQIQREWAERMDNTRYQRAIKDMESAGLNPILAVTGGIDTGGASGTAATVGGAQMSSAQSAMTSGGLLGADSASISGYQGQMENMSSTLALIGAVMGGLSSAMKSLGSLGDFGEGLGTALGELLTNQTTNNNWSKDWWRDPEADANHNDTWYNNNITRGLQKWLNRIEGANQNMNQGKYSNRNGQKHGGTKGHF